MFVNRVQAATAPIFKESFGFTNLNMRLRGFNNAGDALVSFQEKDDPQLREAAAVLRNGVVQKITPVPDARVDYVAAWGLSQRRDNGNVYVAGSVNMKDGYQRACVWDLAADGTFSFTIAPNIILPAESSAPGEQPRAAGAAINKAGVMVGGGVSYLAGVAVRWLPPYNVAQRYILSTGSAFVDINESGLMLANGVEFDHGADVNRYSAALVTGAGSPTEIPLLEIKPGQLYPNYTVMMRDEWVIGNAQLSGATRAFVWKMGTSGSINLPNPPFALSASNTDALAVNSSGTALGRVNGGTGSGLLVLWENKNGAFVPHAFSDLLPLDPYFFYSPVNEAFINDAGQVAATVNGPGNTTMRIYDPVADGIVQFATSSGFGSEEDGQLEFKVTLARSPQNAGPVTVNFQTSDETATSPADYAAMNSSVTWAPGESGDKTIAVPVVDDLIFDEAKTFKLRLTGVAGAQLGGLTEAQGYLYDNFQQVTSRNEILTDGGYGVGVIEGASEVILQLERTGGTDGRLTVTNFQAFDGTAHVGTDYQWPANLSLMWAAGEGGVKTIRIPLLATSPLPAPRVFSITANMNLEGASFNGSFFGNVVILPKQNQTAPVLNSAGAALTSGNKLKFTVSAPEGSIVQLQSLAALGAAWGIQSEATVVNGEVTFEITVDPSVVERFFQVRSKP